MRLEFPCAYDMLSVSTALGRGRGGRGRAPVSGRMWNGIGRDGVVRWKSFVHATSSAWALCAVGRVHVHTVGRVHVDQGGGGRRAKELGKHCPVISREPGRARQPMITGTGTAGKRVSG